jgi:hypothetical protein
MSFVTNLIFGIILLLIVIYIIVYYIYPSAGNNDVLSKLSPLNVKTDVLISSKTQYEILGGSGSTVMGFFKLNSGDRTINTTNAYKPLIQVENNWYLEISPAPIGQDHIASRLRIQTNDAGTFKEEIIELPQIPRQKWVFIAILRDGRRFDIIYDNMIVASQRLQNYPVVISSPLSVGTKGIDGSVIHIMVNNTRLTPAQVERERVSHVDTNNNILEDNKINMSLPGINLFAKCPPGLPCDNITKPPSNNLLQWKTNYA